MLGNNVSFVPGSGFLRVSVDNMTQPYAITLRDLKGREVFRKTNIAAGVRTTEIAAPAASQSVYAVEVRSAGDAYSKVVTF
jgi:hypothetical protein